MADGYVCSDGQQIAPVAEFADQAVQFAAAGQQPAGGETEWMPLGVFAIVPTEDADAEVLVQLALGKDGTISGTYVNGPAGISLPLAGAVDKTTQRAAWKVGEEDAVVMETQLDSLTKDQSTVLLYFEGGVTESWWMFRIDQETAAEIQKVIGAGAARSALAESYGVLEQSLDDRWRSYLALPEAVFTTGDPPDVESLRRALAHYDNVASDATYATVAAYPGFAETHQALKALVTELSAPPPPGS